MTDFRDLIEQLILSVSGISNSYTRKKAKDVMGKLATTYYMQGYLDGVNGASRKIKL